MTRLLSTAVIMLVEALVRRDGNGQHQAGPQNAAAAVGFAGVAQGDSRRVPEVPDHINDRHQFRGGDA